VAVVRFASLFFHSQSLNQPTPVAAATQMSQPDIALSLQRQYNDQAFRLLSQGLDLDEKDPTAALECYKRGAQVLTNALQLQFPPQQQ
jgi:hypothetical protein